MFLLEPDPLQYRTHFFLGLLNGLFPPFVTTYLLLLSIRGNHRCDAFSILAYVMSPCIWISLRSWYTTWSNDRHAQQLGAIPIPRARGKWPGNIDIMFKFARDLRQGYALESMGDLLDEYHCNTLNTRILWQDNFITRDNHHMYAVHSTSFDSFERGPEQRQVMSGLDLTFPLLLGLSSTLRGSFLGQGIFVSDGQLWKQNRAMLRPFLSKERMSDYDLFSKHAETVLAILTDVADTQQPVDIQDVFSRFTLDVASEFILGFYPDSLSGPRPVPFKSRIGAKGSAIDDEFGTFAQAFEQVQYNISMRFRLGPFWPLYELFGDRTLPGVTIINKWVKPIVTNALEAKERADQQGIKLSRQERTLLDSLVEHTDDEETVRYGLLNVMMASRDTTSALITHVVYLLTQHKEVSNRLRGEVISVCGSSGTPTHENISKMSYMSAVLNETLRLFPGAPMGVRNAVRDVLLPSSDGGPPLYFPPKARITWLTLHLHRRQDLWGEDSHIFDPDRWLDPKRIACYRQDPSIFVPFLSGPRMCPGQVFALTEVSFLLCKLIQRFSEFELATDAIPQGAAPPEAWKRGTGRKVIEKVWPATAFTAYVKGGLWITLHQ